MTPKALAPVGGSTRFVRIRWPLRVEHVAAHGTEAVRDVILVEHRDGVREHWGWGECPTLSTGGYVGGTTEEAWAAVLGLASGAANAPGLPTMLRAACRDAALDAALRAAGRPLSEHLGATLAAVPTCRVIAVPAADRAAAVARALADLAAGRDGAALIKVKIDGPDLAGLQAVRSQVGPAVPLAADANGTAGPWTDELARGVMTVGLAYLEQPAPPHSADGRTWESASSPVRIALDESLDSLDALREAFGRGPVIASIKPARLGGIAAAAQAVGLARAGGFGWFVGGMLETGIGRAGALAVAAIGGSEMLPTDLGPSSRYADIDVCEPVELTGDGRVRVPDGPGIGRRPEDARLAALMVDEVIVRAR